MIGNYFDLTIKQYLRCKTIADMETDPLQRNIRMLAEITGKTVDELEELPIKELQSQIKEFGQIEAMGPDTKVNMKLKVDGKRFQCIWKTQDMTAYQYIDATHFCKEPETNIHNILAAITVERDFYGRLKPYNGNTHKERADLFYNHMKIKDAYPIMLFFCKYSEALSVSTQSCLITEVAKLRRIAELHKQEEALNKSGGGLLQ